MNATASIVCSSARGRLLRGCGLVATLLLGLALSQAAAANGPVARVTQVQGTVEMSRNQGDWQAVARTTYLFPGQSLRTGEDGEAVLINQVSGEVFDLAGNTELAVGEERLETVAGNDPQLQEADSDGVWESLRNRFASSQRYTTVRRNVTEGQEHPRVDTARSLTVAAPWPDLVWSNAGPEYSYRLKVDDRTFEVAPESTSEMIRFTLPELEPGDYDYQVELLLDGEVVQRPRRPSRLTWLDQEAVAGVQEKLEAIRSDPVRDDPFVVADLFERQGLMVPALDTYRDYFQDNPDANAMRPFLIKAYHELRLLDLRRKEAITYNTVQMMNQPL